MREIKFRAWIKDENEEKMVYGKDATSSAHFTDSFKYRKNEIVLMQYTGLHDKTDDKVEIYEGDIVEFLYKDKMYIGEVKFKVGTFILACNQLPDGYITMLDIANFDGDYYWIEGVVRGNVCETPQLLLETLQNQSLSCMCYTKSIKMLSQRKRGEEVGNKNSNSKSYRWINFLLGR